MSDAEKVHIEDAVDATIEVIGVPEHVDPTNEEALRRYRHDIIEQVRKRLESDEGEQL